jgi:hypothetical protein
MGRKRLTLREALASDQLEDFVQQEEARGAELAKGSDLERALALLVTTRRRSDARSAHSTTRCGRDLPTPLAVTCYCWWLDDGASVRTAHYAFTRSSPAPAPHRSRVYRRLSGSLLKS